MACCRVNFTFVSTFDFIFPYLVSLARNLSKCLCACNLSHSLIHRLQVAYAMCLSHEVEASESTVLAYKKATPPAAVICRKSKQLRCDDGAAVESGNELV